MSHTHRTLRASLLLAAAACLPLSALAQTLAFPTAEGYGRFSKGGRGGRVIEVTNLDDSGPGSLRAAIDATGPRIIVFKVSGVITLKSKLLISGTKGNGYVTLAGQTAPGKGICIRGWTFGMTGGSDVIIRHIRLRLGDIAGVTMDGMGMASGANAIYDHCSISWTIDEAFSSRGAKNVTIQRSLISEALNDAGHDIQGGQHGYAASIGGDIGSFHHNLLAHCAGRNWSMAGGLGKDPVVLAGKLDIFNNVVYNWKDRTTDGGAHQVNFVNNYYKPGPATTQKGHMLYGNWDGFPGTQTYYCAGNFMKGVMENISAPRNGCKVDATNPKPWTDQPHFPSHAKIQTAAQAYDDVLANVGATRPVLDDHDKRVIEETRNGTAKYKGGRTGLPGLPDSQNDVGGWEAYPSVTRPADFDSDRDGMPDGWERKHGLNPAGAADGNGTQLSKDGYTNVEMYLNELAGDLTVGTTALGAPIATHHPRHGLQGSVVLTLGPPTSERRYNLGGRSLP